ncbi:alpha/beta fold hydrolase [Streptomyces sp. TRM70350]|uniref:alpha/beta fold hydrolase n=1 Tax=Streptomyces sp. TRM70350 TaxID=2856165 RepID=UPI001C477005|nr:alpha/beta hydrolase [Streptomyces sp. TRM70350]MBV7698808.1 alpha/beta hydrolase [Streptomyces sp. TRM70350]
MGLLAAFTATCGTAVSPAFADGTAPRTGDKPTVVLVHGAFADTSAWSGVAERLRAAGLPVIAPANPLRGLQHDGSYIASVLRSIKGPIVLVGHSYGGSVINEAALGNPNVKALVFAAGFLPAKGESAGELAAKFPGSTLGQALSRVPCPLPGGGTGSDLYIKQDMFHKQFAADVPSSKAAVMAATQRPVVDTALTDKATGEAWKTIPSFDLIASDDKNIPAAAQRWMAKRANAVSVEVPSSHAAPVSHPEELTRLIQRAAGVASPSSPSLAATGRDHTWTLVGLAAGTTTLGAALVTVMRRRRNAAASRLSEGQ